MQDNILMNLAVCNHVDKVKDFENKIELSRTINEMITPIVKEREQQEQEDDYDDDKVKELPKTITDVIREKRDKISKLKKDKEEKILVMLGQIYNGVIIPQKLSVRRGEFFRYRCQYSLDLNNVKQELLTNLHAVSEKITNSKNLDVLEYCLQVWNKEEDEHNNNRYGNNKHEKCGKKDMRFDEIKIIETDSKSDDGHFKFEIMFTNGVCVYDDGEVEFFYELGKERTKRHFQSENFNALYNKFKDRIKVLSEDFIKKLDEEIKIRSDELEEVKLKGSHLLMSAELQKGSDDIKGFGN